MFDIAVIGGSFAGLTAALQLGRASRSVVVIDAGRPRNRTSSAAHGVAGWDGVAPKDILARFRADLAAGDVARPMPNINFALADGAQAGIACHASLFFPISSRPRRLLHDRHPPSRNRAFRLSRGPARRRF